MYNGIASHKKIVLQEVDGRVSENFMARIFVSYNRKSTEFCKRLTDELQKRDLDFWVDWEGIPPTVDWMKEIEKGIEEADSFLAIVTPAWIASKVCIDELAVAVKNGKRLIPVVPDEISWNDVPPALAQLNYIFFTEKFDFNSQLKKLFTALDTDYDWLKTHRRLQVKALEWERSNKDGGFLLHGKDLEEAEAEISINANKDPHPTDIQREHVLMSRQGATRQRRITTGILVFIIFMLVGISAYFATPPIQEAIAKTRSRGELILIQGGITKFGTERKDFMNIFAVPIQEIPLSDFYISKYEVTNYQYGQCVKYGNCTIPLEQADFIDPTKQNYPVVFVTLYQASTYCKWVDLRLLTEVEWERAARGPNRNDWPWGANEPTSEFVNMPAPDTDQPTNGTRPVDSNASGVSSEGVYNLVGNVWEWTSSNLYQGGDYDMAAHWDGTSNNFKGTDAFATRGGGWENKIEDISQNNPNAGFDVRNEMGIRCGADIK